VSKEEKQEVIEETIQEIDVLPNHIITLVNPFTQSTIYIVGTAHVSLESVKEVRQVIRFVKPDVVFLELCHERQSVLTTVVDVKKTITISDVLKRSQTEGVFSAILSYFYGKVMNKLKVAPGSEFRAGFEEARKLNAGVVLGDRPISITIKRAWAKLSLFEKLKFIYFCAKDSFSIGDLNIEDIENLKNTDIYTQMVEEFTKYLPVLAETLLHERDLFLSTMLKKCPGNKIVAVVGLGHVEGIKKYWNDEIDIIPILKIPETISFIKTVLMIISVFIILFGVFSCFC